MNQSNFGPSTIKRRRKLKFLKGKSKTHVNFCFEEKNKKLIMQDNIIISIYYILLRVA